MADQTVRFPKGIAKDIMVKIQGQIHFQFPGWKVRCNFNSYTTYEHAKKIRPKRRHRSSQRQRNQLPKNEEEGQVVNDEPTAPKTSSQPKQVWKEKVASSSESPSQEVQPSRSPSPGPIYAPIE